MREAGPQVNEKSRPTAGLATASLSFIGPLWRGTAVPTSNTDRLVIDPRTAPDLCVIGASEAGRAAAVGAVALGLSVTLIDNGDAEGLSNPDLVLEALRIEAKRAAEAARAPDGSAIWQRLDQALKRAAAERRHVRLAAMNIQVVHATGRFADRATVVAGDATVRAHRTFIATGGEQPGIFHAASDETVLTIPGLRHLRSVPRHILVLGGSAEALSAAQSLRRLGADVTVMAKDFLPDHDPELTAPLLRQLGRDGVELTRATVTHWFREGPGMVARLADGATRHGSHLLMAGTARPAVGALDLGRAEVRLDGAWLKLTPTLRTTNPRVYAIGTAAGATSTVGGIAQAGIALRSAFLRLPGRFRPEAVATVSTTDPQIATVGLSTCDAGAGPSTMIWRWPLSQTGAGIASAAAAGHVKVVTDRRGRIQGVGVVGREVRDLLPFWSLALQQGLALGDLVDVSLPSPSWSEASRALVLSHAAGQLGNPWVKRALRAVRWLG